MEARSARSRKWVGRALRAGRAAAFLVLATGINGTISALYPRYEPIYVYLLSIVVVAWLGSVLLGVTTAVAAVILYDWMFSPLQSGLSASSVIPFSVAIAAALATSMARAPLKARQEIAPSPPPPLLPVLDAEILQKQPSIDVDTVRELERKIAAANASVANEARMRSESMTAARVRQETLESELTVARTEADRRLREAQDARRELDAERRRAAENEERVAALQRELNTLRPAASQGTKQADAMRIQLDAVQRRAADNDQRLSALQREVDEARAALDEARSALAEHETRSVSIQQELDLAWSRTDEEKARADREAALRTRLERTAGTDAQQAVAAATAKYETTIRTLRHELEAARIAAEEQQKRADREATLRGQLEAAARETLQRTAGVSASHQRSATEAQETARRAAGRIAELEEQLYASVSARDEDRQSFNRELQTLRAELEAAVQHGLQLTAGVSSSQESALAEAQETARRATERIEKLEQELSESASARDEDRQSFNRELETLRAELDDQRSEIANEKMRREAAVSDATRRLEEEQSARAAEQSEWNTKLERIVTNITTDYEESLGEAMVQREGARAELRNLTAKADQLRTELERLRQEAKKREEESSINLQRIVAGITTDYEESLGEALITREAARAELRELTKKNEQLKAELERARDSAAKQPEQADPDALAKLESEWNIKLERIVAGITTDYEESIGEALITREAARAELRELTKKNEQLKAELQRARDTAAKQPGTADQDALAKLENEWNVKLERIVAGITTDYEESLGEAMIAREAARAELRNLTAKTDRLRQELDAATKRADEEKAARDKMDLEWSEKLQKIVTHLATDHEHDLGEAMLEKEAAKAEVRSLTGRAAKLQERLEQEREIFRQWKDKWKNERLELGGVPKATLTDGQVPIPSVGGGAVILLVHSDLAIRMTAKNALEQSGYIVVTASDGLEALRTSATIKPHVVLAEAVMPKMNGRELVQLLKAKPQTADVKIVLMSGAFSTGYGADFKADDFIQNPRDLAAMRDTVANVLKKEPDSPA